MDDDRTTPRFSIATDIALSAAILTRLPVPAGLTEGGNTARATWAFPLTGAFIGLVAGLVLAGATAAGLPDLPAAALALVALVFLTGALHEDGIADCADGLGGGRDRQTRLDIMRDSRIGAYGTVALILSFALRWSTIATLAGIAPVAALVVAGALSRLPVVAAMALLPHARNDGYARAVGRPKMPQLAIAALITVFICGALLGWVGVIALAVACLAAMPVAALARARLGGQTGDVLGGIQQCAEIGSLLALCAVLT